MQTDNNPLTRVQVDQGVFKALVKEGHTTFKDGDTDVVEVDRPTYTYVKRYGATRAQMKARRKQKK